ncbi:MBL fold metallo-hydrolase [Jeotgalibacillus sp. S-D1]|uniref:MBL fold metallo-hydrolase n=1 Tax=Jeotgalibacillus sp. S-D1 TaxID=2552189 RepID=UPI00105A69B7|nr:MBL fold metallo-hydrolase [Jeotgalibacillus sp. S-D1]TDL34550.1 MBL fold metallo-hydrolase [Jeotgalibacillus sp. S-D1]
MEWYQMPLGPLQTNAYLLYDSNLNCLIIDPGEEANKVRQFVSRKNLNPNAIILTHAHFDHIGAVDDLRDFYQIPVYLHQAEKKWLSDPAKNGSSVFQGILPIEAREPDYLFSSEGIKSIGSWTFELFETPGHSPGSVSLYFKDAEIVISGDALFQGSIGRTDLRGGDHDLLLKSIHQKLLSLPEETYVLPGHGPVTTIEHEMNANPFLNGFS